MKATINIRDLLIEHFGATLYVPALIEIDEMMQFCEIPTMQELDIPQLLGKHRTIGVLWSIQHVHDERPDLTDYEAWKVLQECERRWDRQRELFEQILKN